MSDKPLVSVITIFLNEEKFINEAIESVFKQTYDNWELLLVDDGSTDHSTEIAKEYALRYPDKVIYLEHEGHQNKGMSASRNLGLAHSHGIFIAYIDGDDVWLPEKLQKQVNIIKQNPDIGLVLNPPYYWHEDGRKDHTSIKLPPGLHARGEWFNRLMESIHDYTAYTCGVLIRKDVLTNVGGSEESFKGHFEDTILWLKIAMHTSIYYDSEYLSLYRIHPEADSQRIGFKQLFVHSIGLNQWLTQYLKQHEMKYLESNLFSVKLFLILGIMRQCYHTEQREIIIALSYVLEPIMPELLKNAEWNYFTAVSFQYLSINFDEAIRRYDIALKYGFNDSGVPLQDGFEEFDARANRGIVHSQLGHFSEALADLQRAVELRPEDRYIKEKLQQLLSTQK